MKHLTTEEQVKILKILAEREIFANGNGRMLFALNENENADLFEILPELEIDKRYVVKVAIGFGGLQQNENEAAMYKDHHDYYPLAHIYYSGKYLLIMEEVDTEEYDDYDMYDYADYDEDPMDCAANYLDYCCSMDSDDIDYENTLKDCAERISCMQALNDLIGVTSDNAQIGYSRYQKKYVAYDYGFNPGESVDRQTSNLSSAIRDADFLNTYCLQLVEVIENDINDDEFRNIEHDMVKDYYSEEEYCC